MTLARCLRVSVRARVSLALAGVCWVWFWVWLFLLASVGCRSEQTLDVLARAEGEGRELWLSELGLYADLASGELAPGLIEFEPSYPLWSDGAEKRRWLRVPPGAQIDTSDPDAWQFPVGTQAFKQFSAQGRRIETRVIARTGPHEYWMGAFVWNDAETDARFVPEGQPNARGTQHDVPSSRSCGACHNGAPGRILGFSAVQTPNFARELASEPLPANRTTTLEPTARRALGYLHANCAHCHNPSGSARPDTDLDLRLSASDADARATAAARTSVGQPLWRFHTPSHSLRVAPGSPERSGLWYRMSVRGDALGNDALGNDALESRATQMPPLGTEVVDAEGLDLVARWIRSLAG